MQSGSSSGTLIGQICMLRKCIIWTWEINPVSVLVALQWQFLIWKFNYVIICNFRIIDTFIRDLYKNILLYNNDIKISGCFLENDLCKKQNKYSLLSILDDIPKEN